VRFILFTLPFVKDIDVKRSNKEPYRANCCVDEIKNMFSSLLNLIIIILVSSGYFVVLYNEQRVYEG
jgi:hypothetical protein